MDYFHCHMDWQTPWHTVKIKLSSKALLLKFECASKFPEDHVKMRAQNSDSAVLDEAQESAVVTAAGPQPIL